MLPPRLTHTWMALFLIFIHGSVALTITITQAAAALPTSSSYTSDSEFKSAMLKAHNFYRGEHNVSKLSWNTTSAAYAVKWAKPCAFKHSGGPTGENLSAGFPNATASVDVWGIERELYNFKNPGFSEKTGHFTQLVWSNTTSVGCGRVNCNGKNGTPGWYVVCEYYPPGNVMGNNNQYFVDNVKPQMKGRVTDTEESGVTADGSRGFAMGGLNWMVVLVAAVGFAL